MKPNKINRRYKFADLFAGIGGFHLAMKSAGANCVFASEWDESARLTYEANFRKKDKLLFEIGIRLFGNRLFVVYNP